MPLPSPNSVKTKIIHLFENKAELQAKEIYTLVNNKKFSCSLQSVYKELNALAKDGIIRKRGKFYSLDSTWIVQLNNFSEKLAKGYFSKKAIISLPETGESYKWVFKNLLDLNDFWGHTLLHIIKNVDHEDILLWYPNVWFYVLDTHKEDRFWKTLSLTHSQTYAIIGNVCFLNQWAEKMLNRNGVNTSLAESPFQNKQSYYYNVVGDYLVTVRLAPIITQQIHRIFQETKSFEDIDISSLIQAFTNTKNCSVIIENNPLKAKKMTKKFEQFFGKKFFS